MLGLFLTHPEVVVDPVGPGDGVGPLRPRAGASTGLRPLPDRPGLGAHRLERGAEGHRDRGGPALSPGSPRGDRRSLLGENDRSATGYLPPEEFERTADSFFAHPTTSIRGWETASSAQDRIVSTVRRISADAPGRRIAYVAHGAVGSLLLSDLMRVPISRELDQPRQGCWFTFDPTTWSSTQGWQPFPEA